MTLKTINILLVKTALAQKLVRKFSSSHSAGTSSVPHLNTSQTNKLAHLIAFLPCYPINENQMPSPVSNANCFPHPIMPTSITSKCLGSRGPNSSCLYRYNRPKPWKDWVEMLLDNLVLKKMVRLTLTVMGNRAMTSLSSLSARQLCLSFRAQKT